MYQIYVSEGRPKDKVKEGMRPARKLKHLGKDLEMLLKRTLETVNG